MRPLVPLSLVIHLHHDVYAHVHQLLNCIPNCVGKGRGHICLYHLFLGFLACPAHSWRTPCSVPARHAHCQSEPTCLCPFHCWPARGELDELPVKEQPALLVLWACQDDSGLLAHDLHCDFNCHRGVLFYCFLHCLHQVL